jgi:dTMP kinase
MGSGLFITFEGIDGAGKSTHIERLHQALQQEGRQVTVSREPGGTALAEKLRSLLLNDSMDALTEALLVFAGRRDHLQQVIEPALARGEVVLCDRYTDATFAYQGAGRGFDLDILSTLERWVQRKDQQHDVRQPDLTLWFDASPQVAAERLSQARQPDRFESLPSDFFVRVAAGYAQRAQQQPQRFARIDADQTPCAVWQQVLAAVAARGWLANSPKAPA